MNRTDSRIQLLKQDARDPRKTGLRCYLFMPGSYNSAPRRSLSSKAYFAGLGLLLWEKTSFHWHAALYRGEAEGYSETGWLRYRGVLLGWFTVLSGPLIRAMFIARVSASEPSIQSINRRPACRCQHR